MKKINGTIVLYNNDKTLLEKAIESFLNTKLDEVEGVRALLLTKI